MVSTSPGIGQLPNFRKASIGLGIKQLLDSHMVSISPFSRNCFPLLGIEGYYIWYKRGGSQV